MVRGGDRACGGARGEGERDRRRGDRPSCSHVVPPCFRWFLGAAPGQRLARAPRGILVTSSPARAWPAASGVTSAGVTVSTAFAKTAGGPAIARFSCSVDGSPSPAGSLLRYR